VAGSLAAAPPTLRHQADSQGDVVVLGATLALDCSSEVPLPPAGSTASCATQTLVTDTAPDLFWRDNLANASITPTQARTSATLVLPAGATVTYARLYWSALKTGNSADTGAILDFKGGPSVNVTADQSWVMSYGFASHPDWYYYQSTGDVTSYVQTWGAGDFRVTDVEALALQNLEVDRAFSSWTLVVFYEKQGDELRNLALFDGFTSIDPGFPGQEKAEVTLSGFLVPPGFSAKMTAFTYEGDSVYTGDNFTFNGTKLVDSQNPMENFFNGSRSYLGSPVSGSQDVPKLSGAPGTMAGFDLDTANVTSLVKAGDTSAKVGAASSLDIFILGGFVTSITNKAPDFPNFTKVASDVNGGSLLPGDIVEYTLSAKNTGNDPSVKTVFTDVLDPGLELVPNTIEIVNGVNAGAKTDAKDADQGEYDAATRTVRLRLGSGANGSTGGTVAINELTTIKFRVMVLAQAGSIPNQGKIDGAGQSGVAEKSWFSDGDPVTPGAQPTTVTIQECNTNADCPANKPYCDPTTKTCQPCSDDSQCTTPGLPACQPDGSCGQCSETNKDECKPDKPACNTFNGTCAPCTPGDDGDASKCVNDPDGPVCRVGQTNETFCGCETDSDCGSPTSGKVCDTANTSKCIDGCRGTDGNGCPDGLECTSTDSSIGQCVPPNSGNIGGNGGGSGNGIDTSGDDGNCGCRVPGGASSSGAGLLALVGLALLGLRRRRGVD
jgi:uncharacterized repeat protein (TIGR01451 family)/MYXO-CTERM domain-containing protein